MQTFAELHAGKLGSVYVRGRYDGLLNGWDVSFFHRDGEGRWLAYYLAHESRRWGRTKLRIEGNRVLIYNGATKVAEYDLQTGAFAHKLQGVTRTKEDGLEGAREAFRGTTTVKPPE